MARKTALLIVRTLVTCLWLGEGLVLAGSTSGTDMQLVVEGDSKGTRVVEFQFELQHTLTLDVLTLDAVAGFVQQNQAPKTANSRDERQLELALEWAFSWGDLNACWEQSDLRFPESAKKDKAEHSLCLGSDLNGDPLSLNLRFEDAFERFSNDAIKNRNDRTFSLTGQLELGAAELEETVKLKGISFPNDILKEAVERTFETQLEGPLFGVLWTLSRKDVQKGFPNAPVKDNAQTTQRITMENEFGVLRLKADQTWVRQVFALNARKNNHTASFQGEARLQLPAVSVETSFEKDAVVFENDLIKDRQTSRRAVEIKWDANRWTVETSLTLKDERFPNNPSKDKRQRVWEARFAGNFNPKALFAPKRLAIEVEVNEQRFANTPAKDVFQATLQVDAQVRLTEALTVALSSSVGRQQWINNPAAASTDYHVDAEVQATF